MITQEHEMVQAWQIKQAEPYANHKPTDHKVKSPWIYAFRGRRREDYPKKIEQQGKWLVFVPTDEVNKLWRKIKRAVELGHLGRIAKVTPIRRAKIDERTNRQCHIICVYTYDWTDKEDVMRIREELRNLGLTQILPYKTDGDTQEGKYYRQGDKDTSTYLA